MTPTPLPLHATARGEPAPRSTTPGYLLTGPARRLAAGPGLVAATGRFSRNSSPLRCPKPLTGGTPLLAVRWLSAFEFDPEHAASPLLRIDSRSGGRAQSCFHVRRDVGDLRSAVSGAGPADRHVAFRIDTSRGKSPHG